MLKLLKIYNRTCGLTVFLFKILNVLNFLAATKNMRTKDTFLLKPTCFLLIRETGNNGKFLKSALTILENILQTGSPVKPIQKAY